MSLNIQHFIQHFENRIRRNDRFSFGSSTGKEPQYPMLVVFLGEEAMKGFPSIASNLFEIWPQYQRELSFIGVSSLHDNIRYCSMQFEENTVKTSDLTSEGVAGVVTSLFGLKNHFQDRSKLFAYYVYDTTSATSVDEYFKWMSILTDTKKALGVDSLDMLDMLIFLLNENFGRRNVANQIRNELSGYYDNYEKNKCNSIFLLSNKRSDHAILEDWNICYRIATSVMLLSNNEDANVSSKFFSKHILTASYSREEKPSEKIGQVIATELVDRVQENFSTVGSLSFDSEATLDKVGLSNDGTFAILDEYVSSVLEKFLPSADQLEYFPRHTMDSSYYVSQLSAKEFNELTMNSWNAYLRQIVNSAKEKIFVDSGIRDSWRKSYKEYLHSKLTTSEVVYLYNYVEELQGKVEQKVMPSQESEVLSAARKTLSYLLSSDPEILNIFYDEIKVQSEKANSFLNEWNALVLSRQNLFSVRDENINSFYSRKVQDFFDHMGHDFNRDIRETRDVQSLVSIIESTLDKIIDGDPVFSAPFEDELESRLNEKQHTADTTQYIRRKLTENELYTYLQVNFRLEEPILSSILIKEGTSLYNNLRNNLTEPRYYYNTGYGGAAEVTVIYEVSKDNLING